MAQQVRTPVDALQLWIESSDLVGQRLRFGDFGFDMRVHGFLDLPKANTPFVQPLAHFAFAESKPSRTEPVMWESERPYPVFDCVPVRPQGRGEHLGKNFL